jgi:hypothetical protein
LNAEEKEKDTRECVPAFSAHICAFVWVDVCANTEDADGAMGLAAADIYLTSSQACIHARCRLLTCTSFRYNVLLAKAPSTAYIAG